VRSDGFCSTHIAQWSVWTKPQDQKTDFSSNPRRSPGRSFIGQRPKGYRIFNMEKFPDPPKKFPDPRILKELRHPNSFFSNLQTRIRVSSANSENFKFSFPHFNSRSSDSLSLFFSFLIYNSRFLLREDVQLYNSRQPGPQSC
jgi:hypothetical protein